MARASLFPRFNEHISANSNLGDLEYLHLRWTTAGYAAIIEYLGRRKAGVTIILTLQLRNHGKLRLVSRIDLLDANAVREAG